MLILLTKPYGYQNSRWRSYLKHQGQIIVEHIGNIYDEGELNINSTCRDFRQVRKEGNRNVSRNIPLNEIKAIERKSKKGGKQNE